MIYAPIVGNLGAMLCVGGFAVSGQQIGQAACLTAAHGVGLAGERERTAADLADLAAGQVQIDQRVVFGTARAGLIQTHAPER